MISNGFCTLDVQTHLTTQKHGDNSEVRLLNRCAHHLIDRLSLSRALSGVSCTLGLICEKNFVDCLFHFGTVFSRDLNTVADDRFVLLSRLTPHEKAAVVDMLRSSSNVCLAVGTSRALLPLSHGYAGDGNNDVEMLTTADIGVVRLYGLRLSSGRVCLGCARPRGNDCLRYCGLCAAGPQFAQKAPSRAWPIKL